MSDSEYLAPSEEEPSSSSSSSGEEYAVSEDEAPRSRKRPSTGGARGRGGGAGGAPKRARAAAQPKLPDLLRSASKEQLVSLVLELNGDSGGQLEGRIAALLPPPDLTGIRASITELERKMSRAFPHAKWGTNRDGYAYKRVGPPLRDLKAALLQYAHTFADCKRYDTLLEYVPFALGVVDSMPHWDADAHNKPKQQAAKQLEGMLVKALKAAALPPEERQHLAQQLERLELPLAAARAALEVA